MRALIVTNMYPTPRQPALGSFVRDQVDALRRIRTSRSSCSRSRRRCKSLCPRGARTPAPRRSKEFDVVHAHYGLTAWPALAANGHRHAITLHGTDLRIPARGRSRSRRCPCSTRRGGVGAARAPHPALGGPGQDRDAAVRRRHGPLSPDRAGGGEGGARAPAAGPYLLFPADPPGPRNATTAPAVAADVPLLALGDVEPSQVPLWVNAANAVLIPSEREGFGLAVLEAMACNVPVLSTPVGILPSPPRRCRRTLRSVRLGEWRTRWRPSRDPGSADRRPGPRAAVLDRCDGGRGRLGMARRAPELTQTISFARVRDAASHQARTANAHSAATCTRSAAGSSPNAQCRTSSTQ